MDEFCYIFILLTEHFQITTYDNWIFMLKLIWECEDFHFN